MKYSKAKPVEGKTLINIAIPDFGYKSHPSIDRAHRLTGKGLTPDASAHDRARLREGLPQSCNTSGKVWADSIHRSTENEGWLSKHGFTSHFHRKRPKGKPMPEATSRVNGRKSRVHSKVEHVFVQQKVRIGLFIRPVGLPRVKAAITLANTCAGSLG